MAWSGELKEDTTWSGRVEIDGDLVVPPGVSLRLLPGTQLTFSQRPRWSCSVFRNAPEGHPIEASHRAFCDIIVQGRLLAKGTVEQPVIFGRSGAAWGGITTLGRGELRLTCAVLTRAREYLLQLFDDSVTTLDRCTLTHAEIGVLAWGLSQTLWADGEAEDLGSVLLSREGALVRVERAIVSRCPQGLWAQQWSLVEARECVFEECSNFGAGSFERSQLILESCRFTRCDLGILAASDSLVEILDTEFLENRVGVQAIDQTSLQLQHCRVLQSREQGAKFSQHSRGLVESSSFKGNVLAGIYSEESAVVESADCDFEANGTALATADQGKLESVHNRIRDTVSVS